MWVLTILSWLGTLFAFIFLTLSIASGLYYLSEFVEEHAELAKRTLQRTIYFVIGIHVLLLVIDKFPFFLTAFSILAHVIYSTNLRKFPFISLSSRSFIASCIFVLLDHYFFFRHFSNLPPPRQALHYSRFSTQPHPDIDLPTFGQVAAFFGICVWLVPFGLFVSLSAGELVLPTIGSDGGITQAEVDKTKAQGLVKQVYGVVGVWVRDALSALGWGTGRQGGYIGYNDRYQ